MDVNEIKRAYAESVYADIVEHGSVREDNPDVNALNLLLPAAVKAACGAAWLVRDINTKGEILTEYVGQQLRVWSFCGVIPHKDELLERLIQERDEVPDGHYSMSDDWKRVSAIQARLKELGSDLLIWC